MPEAKKMKENAQKKLIEDNFDEIISKLQDKIFKAC